MGYPKPVVKAFISLWPVTRLAKRLSARTPFRQLSRLLANEKIMRVTFVPVAEDIQSPQSTALPKQAIAMLIEESSHRFIHDGCICRNHEGCTRYPRELGCIFLGEAAAHLHPSLGHRASVEECLAHLEKASRAGLTGMVGQIWFDATSLGVLRHFRDFLVVCFCCDCCCLVRTDMRQAGPAVKGSISRLQSVRVRVTEACAGCGTCERTCFVGAVALRDGRAHIDEGQCKGCGRCSQVCPNHAIQVTFDREDELLRELLRRAGAAIGPHRAEERAAGIPCVHEEDERRTGAGGSGG